jgi:hypothetical protein
MQHGSYLPNLASSPLHGNGEQFQLPAPPIVNGVPKVLYTEDEVAAMYSFSVSTVRNRCNPKSRWYDPNFPQPRSTDGSGEGRKAAVRWHWRDLCRYDHSLPPVSYSKLTRGLKRPVIADFSDKPFDL